MKMENDVKGNKEIIDFYFTRRTKALKEEKENELEIKLEHKKKELDFGLVQKEKEREAELKFLEVKNNLDEKFERVDPDITINITEKPSTSSGVLIKTKLSNDLDLKTIIEDVKKQIDHLRKL